MGFLDFLFCLLDLYAWFVAGPRAIYRCVRRWKHPAPEQIAASTTPEMHRFRRNVWLVSLGWLMLSFIMILMPGSSPWLVVIALAIGLLLLPGMIEKRYDRLVAELSSRSAKD